MSNNANRTIFTEENELAAKSLETGTVDFFSPEVAVKQAKADIGGTHLNAKTMDVNLGKVTSVPEGKVLSDKANYGALPKGTEVVDESTQQGLEYDLVMVG